MVGINFSVGIDLTVGIHINVGIDFMRGIYFNVSFIIRPDYIRLDFMVKIDSSTSTCFMARAYFIVDSLFYCKNYFYKNWFHVRL